MTRKTTTIRPELSVLYRIPPKRAPAPSKKGITRKPTKAQEPASERRTLDLILLQADVQLKGLGLSFWDLVAWADYKDAVSDALASHADDPVEPDWAMEQDIGSSCEADLDDYRDFVIDHYDRIANAGERWDPDYATPIAKRGELP